MEPLNRNFRYVDYDPFYGSPPRRSARLGGGKRAEPEKEKEEEEEEEEEERNPSTTEDHELDNFMQRRMSLTEHELQRRAAEARGQTPLTTAATEAGRALQSQLLHDTTVAPGWKTQVLRALEADPDESLDEVAEKLSRVRVPHVRDLTPAQLETQQATLEKALGLEDEVSILRRRVNAEANALQNQVAFLRGGGAIDVARLEKRVDRLTHAALQPFFSFIGRVSAAAGIRDVRSHYRWVAGGGLDLRDQQRAVVVGNATLQDFVDSNVEHLGPKLLGEVIADAAREAQPPGALAVEFPIGLIGLDLSAADLERFRAVTGVEPDNAVLSVTPEWAWCALRTEVFSYLLRSATWGAIELAADQIRSIPGKEDFTIKEMMAADSGTVSTTFARYVAQQMLGASGGNAYQSIVQPRGGSEPYYRVSTGFQTRLHDSLIKRGNTFYWNTVTRVRNPEFHALAKEEARIEQRRAEIMNAMASNELDEAQQAYDAELEYWDLDPDQMRDTYVVPLELVDQRYALVEARHRYLDATLRSLRLQGELEQVAQNYIRVRRRRECIPEFVLRQSEARNKVI